MKYILGLSFLFVASLFVYADHRVFVPSYAHGYVQPTIIAIPVAPDYYYSVGDGENPDERAKRIAKAVVREFEEKFQINGGAPVAPKANRSDFRIGGKADGLSNQVSALFQARCIQCHKPGAPGPGVQLFNLDRSNFVNSSAQKEYLRRVRVYEAVESGDMPKGGQPMSAGQKSLLKAWLDEVKVQK